MNLLPIARNKAELDNVVTAYLDAFSINGKGEEISNTIFDKLAEAHLEATNPTFKKVLFYFKKNKYKNLKRCITGDISVLEEIVSDINIIINTRFKFYKMVKGKPQSNEFGAKIIEIFNYGWIRSNQPMIKLFERVASKTCPYCNQHEIQFINYKTKKKALLDLDHYFPKVFFPYLSASIFNLIPCCSICNSRFKGAKTINTSDFIYPYIDSFDSEAKFSIGTKVIYHAEDDVFDISIINLTGSNKIAQTIEDLGLQARYENYHSEILRIWQFKHDYSDEEIEQKVDLHRRSLPGYTREKFIKTYLKGSLNANEILDFEKGKLIKDMAIHFEITY